MLLFCLMLMSGCIENNIPVLYRHYVNNRDIYIANIGLGTTDFARELTNKGTPLDKITILDDASSKEKFLPSTIIEVNTLVFLLIDFNDENMKKKNTSFEEEVARAETFSRLKNFCSVVVLIFGNKDFYLSDTPFFSFKELDVAITVAEYSKIVIFIEAVDTIQREDYTSMNIKTFSQALVQVDGNRAIFLLYHSYNQFISHFLSYIY